MTWDPGGVYHGRVCRHCRGPMRVRPGGRWPVSYATRIGPSARWVHDYCSEACWEHADEYSAEEWRRYHAGLPAAVARCDG